MALGSVRDEFTSLNTQPRDFLDEIQGRQACPKCGKSRKFYCYSCYVLMEEVKMKLKTVKLPLKIDIIKHRNEVDGKSTAPHAKVISPLQVSIYEYPCIPDYDKSKVILVFPCSESVSLDQLCVPVEEKHCVEENLDRAHQVDNTNSSPVKPYMVHHVNNSLQGDNSVEQNCCANKRKSTPEKSSDNSIEEIKLAKIECVESNVNSDLEDDSEKIQGEKCFWKRIPSFEKVVFIDSTWLQSKQMFKDERLNGLTKVELKTRETRYWRPQGSLPMTYLATIEAVYYFLRDFHQIFISDLYSGEYDNLLFFFLYTYNKIQTKETSKKTKKR